MRNIKTSEAAAMLNVSSSTLRTWERRFGFPKPARSRGQHPSYIYGEVAALQAAMKDGLSISSAVSRVREAIAADSTSLLLALVSYDGERADIAIEATLALRSVERSVEEVLLEALAEILRRHTAYSAAWAFASRWATGWLSRAQRLTPTPSGSSLVLVGDATRDELDPDTPFIGALELFLVRAGIRVLHLSARGIAGIGDAVAVHNPDLVVIAGSCVADETVAKWAYSVRIAAGAMPVAIYRRRIKRPNMPTAEATVLPSDPLEAHERLLELINVPHLYVPAAVESAASSPAVYARSVNAP